MKLPQWLRCLMGRHGPWMELPNPYRHTTKRGMTIMSGVIVGPPLEVCVHCGADRPLPKRRSRRQTDRHRDKQPETASCEGQGGASTQKDVSEEVRES